MYFIWLTIKTNLNTLISMNVILVDENDNEIGTVEKLEAHKSARLHRAFSVFIFNSKNELMLQKRASGKYHSAGLWTNTCCSHPRPGKDIIAEAKNKLRQEMGFACELKEMFSFIYNAHLDNSLTEHEFDHVLFGRYDYKPVINNKEAENWKWISLSDLKESITKHPENYTAWLRICLPDVEHKFTYF
jgi:isopentenyl-diphosphate delta-isomerase